MKAGMTRCLVTALLVCAMLGSAGQPRHGHLPGGEIRCAGSLSWRVRRETWLVEMQSLGKRGQSSGSTLCAHCRGTPPDLALTHLQTHAENVEYGLYADLTPFVERDRVDLYRFFPKGGVDALEQRTGNGIPSQLSTHLLWYNKTLLDADGMPYPSAIGV